MTSVIGYKIPMSVIREAARRVKAGAMIKDEAHRIGMSVSGLSDRFKQMREANDPDAPPAGKGGFWRKGDIVPSGSNFIAPQPVTVVRRAPCGRIEFIPYADVRSYLLGKPSGPSRLVDYKFTPRAFE